MATATTTTTQPTKTVTFRLRRKLVAIHRSRAHDKAPSYLRQEIAKHSKSSVDDVKLSTDINRWLQANNSNKFKPIKIVLVRNGEAVEASLADELKKTLPQKAVVSAQKKDEKKEEKPKAREATPPPKKDATAKQAQTAQSGQAQQKQEAAAKPKAKAKKPTQTSEAAQPPAQ